MRSPAKIVSLSAAATALVMFSATLSVSASCAVILVRRADAVAKSLPAAANFFVRKVAIGEADIAKVEARGNFRPDVSNLKFFYGRDKSGRFVGTMLFYAVDSEYGALQVGVAFSPAGSVTNVVVTKATCGSKPWIESLMSSGWLKVYDGMSGNSMFNPITRISPGTAGTRPYMMAEAITTAVVRCIVYYDMLFQPNLPR